jgi:hypothetical protein
MALANSPIYVPTPIQTRMESVDGQFLQKYLQQQLQNISVALQQTTAEVFVPISAAPSRPTTGMIVDADGTNWNPGSGAGLYAYIGGVWIPLFVPPGSTRIILTAATTFYVGTNGSDANNGLTSGTPWKTLAHAMSVIIGQYDFGGQTVTLQVVAGSSNYTERLTLSPWVGGGSFIFDGGGKTINYAGVATNDGTVFLQGGALPGIATIQNVTIASSQGASSLVTGIFVQSASSLKIGSGVTFGSNFSAHMLALNPGSIIFLAASLTISGNSPNGFFVNGGVIRLFGGAISITFSAAVSIGVVADALNGGGLISLPSSLVTWVNPGNVTGQRYSVASNAIITTAGGGLNFIPGTIAGTTSSGGQYT